MGLWSHYPSKHDCRTAALLYSICCFSNCKSLGFNYLQINCCFTILHKIILVMMKRHWGGCSDGRIRRRRKYKMPLCQSDRCKECDACHLNCPHNVTFKHCKDILLFLSLLPSSTRVEVQSSNYKLFLSAVHSHSGPHNNVSGAIFCSAFNSSGVKHIDPTVGPAVCAQQLGAV